MEQRRIQPDYPWRQWCIGVTVPKVGSYLNQQSWKRTFKNKSNCGSEWSQQPQPGATERAV